MRRPVPVPRRLARAPVALAALAALAASVPHAAGASPPGAGATWSPPVAGAVVDAFRAPRTVYGPGHRGVDYAPPPGTPVLAAGAGTVVFAGDVAGTLHVVVAHAGGLRTSYSFLATVATREGAAVRRGDVLGRSGGPAADHPPGRLHFGLRVGDRYVDPMVLFRPPDLAAAVHLAPVGGEPPVPETRAAARHDLTHVLGLGPPVPASIISHDRGAGGALGDAAGFVLGRARAGLDGLVAFGASAVELAGRGGAELGRLARWLYERTPLAPVVRDARSSARRLAAWLRTRGHCTPRPPRADGTGGSGHLLMAVAGIGSATDPGTGRALGLPTERLGYRRDEVRWFSYAPDGGAYDAGDSSGELHAAALRLGEQLEAMAREQPGREVDLVAHSQGGVVVDEFIRHVYDARDPAYPPLGTVVTLASPHRGVPLATAAAAIGATRVGGAALQAGAARLDAPAPDSVAVHELVEGSEFMQRLWHGSQPDHFDITSLGAPDDYVVPATQIAVPGATEVLVDPSGVVDDHAAITTDSRALAAVRLALEGRPPPCTSWLAGVRGAVEPVVITRVEHAAGALGRRGAGLVDRMLAELR